MNKPGSKKPAVGVRSARPAGKIHPIIIYPFAPPPDYRDLEALFSMISKLDSDRETYTRPITVVDRKTCNRASRTRNFQRFRSEVLNACTDVLDAWCVDTCQMWYAGLGLAFERGGPDDIYWLIPGDFNYGSTVGQEVLGRLHDLPEIILELQQDICIGEIATDHNDSKQLIDTYGTFGLLYNWFPVEAQEIRQLTERPRSEFFALRHSFLREMLSERWYPYEQTVVMLLKAVFKKRKISRFFVGQISDLPHGRESLSSAISQVERTERVLKTLWREHNELHNGWMQRYRKLEKQSECVRRSAITILENLLA